MVVAFFRIFENMLVITPPPKSCDARAPLGLRRPRVPTTSPPHSSTTTCREKTGVGAPPRRGGSVEIALPGTARLAPGVAWNSKQLEIPLSPRALQPPNRLLLACEVYCSTYCCIAVPQYWVGPWMVGGGWVVDGGSLAPRDGRVSSKNETPPVCFLFHARSSRTNEVTAPRVPGVLLYALQYCCM